MKQFFAMLLALAMTLSLAACGGGSGSAGGSQPSGGSAGGDKVVKIGVFEPATGDSGAGGKQDRKSVV